MIQLPLPGTLTEETIVPYLKWRFNEVYEQDLWRYTQLCHDAWLWTVDFEAQEWFITKLMPQTEELGPWVLTDPGRPDYSNLYHHVSLRDKGTI